MDPNTTNVHYSDADGKEYTETSTSPGMAIIRAEELEQSGYTVS